MIVNNGDVFESRVRPGTEIRIVMAQRCSIDVETLRADGTGIRARNIAWSTLYENYRKATP